MPNIQLEYNAHIKNKYDAIRKYRIFLKIAGMITIDNTETRASAINDRLDFFDTSIFIYAFINSDLKLYETLDLDFDDFMLKIENDPAYSLFIDYKKVVTSKDDHYRVKNRIKYREKILAHKYIGKFMRTTKKIVLTKHGFKISSDFNNSCYFSINSGYIKLERIEKNFVVTKTNYVIEQFNSLIAFVSNMDELIDVEDCYLKEIVDMMKV